MGRLKNQSELVILAPSFYPNTGGVEKHLEKVCEGLVKRGWAITVLVRYGKGYPKSLSRKGVHIVRMPKSDSSKTMWLWYLKNRDIFNNAMVIHSHDYFPFALRKLIKNKRWVHTFHGYEGYPLDPRAIESRKNVAKAVDYTFCVGEFIEKWYGTKCDEVIWGAAEPAKHQNQKTKWDFIFFGRYEPDTGFAEYLKGFRLIAQKQSNANMLVLGHGSQESWAKGFAKDNQLNIQFHEPVANVEPFLQQARAAFVSGYLAIIECGLDKKPVVAYYGTPIKKDYLTMHPEAKAFAVVSTAKQIAEAGLKALKPDPKDIQSLYSWSKSQTWDKIINQYEKAYNEKN